VHDVAKTVQPSQLEPTRRLVPRTGPGNLSGAAT